MVAGQPADEIIAHLVRYGDGSICPRVRTVGDTTTFTGGCTLERDGIAAHVLLDRSCTDERCDSSGTLTIDGDDAHISARFAIDVTNVRFELAGAERLVFDRIDAPLRPCLQWRIVETGRTGPLPCAR